MHTGIFMKARIVYALVDPRSGLIRYVGLSTQGLKRPNQHIIKARRGEGTNPHTLNWLKSLLRAGMKPGIVVLSEHDADCEMELFEDFWIRYYRAMGFDLTNQRGGGFHGRHSEESNAKNSAKHRGKKLTAQHRAAISASGMGRKNPNSPETRAKMSASHMGKKLSTEHVAKLTHLHRTRVRKPFSAETKAKMSAAKLGKMCAPHSDETKAKMRATHQARHAVRLASK